MVITCCLVLTCFLVHSCSLVLTCFLVLSCFVVFSCFLVFSCPVVFSCFLVLSCPVVLRCFLILSGPVLLDVPLNYQLFSVCLLHIPCSQLFTYEYIQLLPISGRSYCTYLLEFRMVYLYAVLQYFLTKYNLLTLTQQYSYFLTVFPCAKTYILTQILSGVEHNYVIK
jgi:hypothetical protein